MLNAKVCINAGTDKNHQRRVAKYPGPRCKTCWLVVQRLQKKRHHDAYVVETYGVEAGFYDKLYRFQKGRCWWCRRATGRKKKLANDHNHKCCPGPTSCGECLRGLLCSKCNRHLGWLGDSIEAMQRMIDYLKDPPAQQLRRIQQGASSDGQGAKRTTTTISTMVSPRGQGGSTTTTVY